jgi:hypothetical protein
VTIDSETGRQCMLDMVAICISGERVAYYPDESLVNRRCPVCLKDMLRFVTDSSTNTEKLRFPVLRCKVAPSIFSNAKGNL